MPLVHACSPSWPNRAVLTKVSASSFCLSSRHSFYTELISLAADHGTDVGQAGADLLAIATGHPELVRRLDQTVLPHSRRASSNTHPHTGQTRPTKIRVPRTVYAHLCHQAAQLGIKAGPLSADLLAVATGHPDLTRELNRTKEALPLAM